MVYLLGVVVALGACGGGGGAGDGAEQLGAMRQLGYRIDPNATVAVSVAGFGVTADGKGGFRILLAGTTSDVLEGTLTSDGAFDTSRTSPLGGKELVANNPDRIEFRVNPSSTMNGLDFATSQAPVYLDLRLNTARVAASIFFPKAGRQQASAYDPVAFTAP